jgi:hypothetical protein
LDDAPVQVVVLLVEYVFFVEVLIVGFELVQLRIFDVCCLGCLAASLQLVV